MKNAQLFDLIPTAIGFAIVFVSLIATTLAQNASIAPSESTNSDAALPPARTEYMGRKIAQTMHYSGAPWLVRESRQRQEDCATMLRELRIRLGHDDL